MKTQTLHLAFLLILIPLFSFSQPAIELISGWEYRMREEGNEKFNKMIVSLTGEIVAVGEVATNSRETDAVFAVIDPLTGDRLVWKTFGQQGNEGFNSVIQRPDGTFILVGYQEDNNRKRKRGWVVIVDEQGTRVDDYLLDLVYADSEVIDVAVNGIGEVLAIGMDQGNAGPEPWTVSIGKHNSRYNRVLLGGGNLGRVTGIAAAPNGDFTVVGSTFPKNKTFDADAWVFQIDSRGNAVWKQPLFFGGRGMQEALDIAESSLGGGFVVTGYNSEGPNGEEDIWLLKLSDEGAKEWERYFGGYDTDMGYAVTELSEGGYAIAGHTKSHMANADISALTIIVTDEGGYELNRHSQAIFQGFEDNFAHSLIELHNGEELVLSGSSTAPKSRHATKSFLGNFPYKLRTFGSSNSPSTTDREPLTLIVNSFNESSGNRVLDPGERGYFSVEVQNNEDSPLLGLTCQVTPVGNNPGIFIFPEISIGTIAAGQSREIRVPVRAAEDYYEGAVELQIAVIGNAEMLGDVLASTESGFAANEPTPEPDTFYEEEQPVREEEPIGTVAAAPARLMVSNAAFSPSGNAEPGDIIKLTMDLTNSGGSASPALTGRFSLPEGVQAQDAEIIRVPGIRAGEKQTLNFYFSFAENYAQNSIEVLFEIPGTGGIEGLSHELSLPVERRPTRVILDEIYWVTPDPDLMRSEAIEVNDQEVNLKVISLSTRDQTRRNFSVRINGRRPQGQKMGESLLSPPVATTDPRRNKRTYSTKVRLEEGLNEVEIIYLDENNQEILSKSRAVTFNYIPRGRPNLYVLSIGVKHNDLKYTVKDASDFALTYSKLKDDDPKGFRKVDVKQLVNDKHTEKTNLQIAFKDLSNQNIKDGDLVVVFISTHGKVLDNGQYYLLPSDFDPLYPDLTALNFNDDVLKRLRSIDGNKLVFVDACHSGLAGARSYNDGAASKVINDLVRSTSGMEIFASCGDREFSYEDEAWNNGAFTKAILEAFNNETVEIDGEIVSADIYRDNPLTKEIEEGSDGVITIGEIREFIGRRVPYLVKRVKGKSQTPTNKTHEHLPENTGIFMIKN